MLDCGIKQEDENMKIKIKRWEELNWKYNEKYVLFYVNSEYKYGNGIRIREKTVGSEVCFIRLFPIDHTYRDW